jgi:hypothetical protein
MPPRGGGWTIAASRPRLDSGEGSEALTASSDRYGVTAP